MRSLLLLVSSLLITLVVGLGEAQARPSARRTIRLSDSLRAVAEDWARHARYRGYRNTYHHLLEISDLTGEVERAVRARSVIRAKRAIDRIVDVAIHMRAHVKFIPSVEFRKSLKKEVGESINELGDEVFEDDWVYFSAYTKRGDGGVPVEVRRYDFDTLVNPTKESIDKNGDFIDDLIDDEQREPDVDRKGDLVDRESSETGDGSDRSAIRDADRGGFDP